MVPSMPSLGQPPMMDTSALAKGSTTSVVSIKSLAIVVEVVRYLSLLCMYGGACVVMYGVFVMTPNTLPPYSQSNLVPGLEIPNPPAPVEDATSLTAWSAH